MTPVPDGTETDETYRYFFHISILAASFHPFDLISENDVRLYINYL